MIPWAKLGRAAGALVLLGSVSGFGAPAVIIESSPLLTIDEAIRTALDKNQDIKVEAFGPPIARANVLAALGQFDPALNFSRSYSRSVTNPTNSDIVLPTTVETDDYSLTLGGVLPTGLNYTVGGSTENQRGTFNNFQGDFVSFGGVNLTQPLLRGFGFAANLVNVRVARANRGISEWQYRQTVINTVTNVIVTYDELVLAHESLRIAQRYRDTGATLLTQSEQRVKAGSGAQSDVITAQAQVAAREEAILEAQNSLRSTDNQLRQLLGETAFPPGQPFLNVAALPVPPVTVDPARDYQEALDRRPDYQAARLGVTINRANNASAKNGLLPQVNLIGSYGYNGLASTFAASREMVTARTSPASSIGIDLSIPITNAQARGRYRAARLTLQQSEANLKDMEAQIAISVANAASQISTAHQRVVVDQAAYQLAVQALAAEEKKLELGSSTTLAVVQDQVSLATAENSLASAQFAESEAVALYDQQLGTTLVRNHIALAEDQ